MGILVRYRGYYRKESIMLACVLPKKIKPCPMCGSKDIQIYDIIYNPSYKTYHIQCNECYLLGSKIFYNGDESTEEERVQKLINYWNNRPGQRPYTYNYDENEVKKLAEERNITEAKARYLIYQREYGKEYRKKNKDRLNAYHKKWDFENRDRISLQSKERYKKKKEKST